MELDTLTAQLNQWFQHHSGWCTDDENDCRQMAAALSIYLLEKLRKK
jgi:hypothetical protein